MSEWRELTWDDAKQRGYEALSHGEALYEEIDAEQGRSNIDIEKHLRRAELKLAQVHAWLAMARELAGNETTPAVGRLAEHRSCRLRPQTGGGELAEWTPEGWRPLLSWPASGGARRQRHPPRDPLQNESG
jgi:predicted transcriptional regulator